MAFGLKAAGRQGDRWVGCSVADLPRLHGGAQDEMRGEACSVRSDTFKHGTRPLMNPLCRDELSLTKAQAQLRVCLLGGCARSVSVRRSVIARKMTSEERVLLRILVFLLFAACCLPLPTQGALCGHRLTYKACKFFAADSVALDCPPASFGLSVTAM